MSCSGRNRSRPSSPRCGLSEANARSLCERRTPEIALHAPRSRYFPNRERPPLSCRIRARSSKDSSEAGRHGNRLRRSIRGLAARLPVQELLFLEPMQPTHKSRSSIVRPRFKRTKQATTLSSVPLAMSTYIADEIRAYATIRDLALAEAEKVTNSLNLERTRIANDFVENALKPARNPYESQHLPEGEATRERQRCEAVKVRLSLLHGHLDALARDHAHAA